MISCLDKGYVRLESFVGGDAAVVRSARVSHGRDKKDYSAERDRKLIEYLLRNGHNTPFESTSFTFEVKAPIFVVRQWQRHRTWSYNEISSRYAELKEEFYVPDIKRVSPQAMSNKQGSQEDVVLPNAELIRGAIERQGQDAFSVYQALIGCGLSRELARTVLPVSTYTRMYATVNLNNLMRFLRERLDSHAQYEIRVYAQALLELAKPLAPITFNNFKEGIT